MALDLQFDVRVIERGELRRTVRKDDLAKHLAGLPDATEKAAFVHIDQEAEIEARAVGREERERLRLLRHEEALRREESQGVFGIDLARRRRGYGDDESAAEEFKTVAVEAEMTESFHEDTGKAEDAAE